MKYKAGKYKDHNEQYKSAEWVGQFTTFLSAPPPPPWRMAKYIFAIYSALHEESRVQKITIW